jgi:hypothetical protein
VRIKLVPFLILFAVSICRAESIGIQNHNPGNITGKNWRAWNGAIGLDPWHHLIFKDDEHGFLAMRKVLRRYYLHYHLETIPGIVNRWIGPPKNHREMLEKRDYLLSFYQRMGVTSASKLDLRDPDTIESLAHAIVYGENGSDPYSEDLYQKVFHHRKENMQ